MSKARSDSILKSRAEQSEEFGDKVAAWVETPKTDECVGGFEYARQQLVADGIKVSVGTLHAFYSWWKLRQDFQLADQQATDVQKLLQDLKVGLTPEQIDTAGQMVFTQKAIANRDSKEFREMEWLRVAKMKEQRESGALKLAREKFEVATCELFLKWRTDKKAEEIANSPISHAEKIAQLRQHYFKDIDELENSGAVKLPE